MRVDIIIVGASARAAAFSALRAGLKPYAIDLFADSDLCAACEAVKIDHYPSDFAKALAVAPAAPWLYTGGLENYPRLIEHMAATRPLFGNPADVLRQVRDPELLAARLRSAGFSVPDSRLAAPADDGTGNRWLRKPRRSSAGLGIRWHHAGNARRDGGREYYQKYIPGASCSAVFAASRGVREFLGATDQQSGVSGLPEQPFLYAGSAGPRILSAEEEEQLKRLGEVLARDFGLRGLFNVDYVHDGQLIWPLEVNPRYSASMEVLEYALGRNLLARHIEGFGLRFPADLDFFVRRASRFAAKGIVYATKDCRVTQHLEKLRDAWNEQPLVPCLADIPRIGDHIRRGQPVATVLAEEETLCAAKLRLEERMKQVATALSALSAD